VNNIECPLGKRIVITNCQSCEKKKDCFRDVLKTRHSSFRGRGGVQYTESLDAISDASLILAIDNIRESSSHSFESGGGEFGGGGASGSYDSSSSNPSSSDSSDSYCDSSACGSSDCGNSNSD
jgi:hypothetical protein